MIYKQGKSKNKSKTDDDAEYGNWRHNLQIGRRRLLQDHTKEQSSDEITKG